ncbi:MAG: hypothetical protein C0485_00485 [Pirellula sp.]|nr:hypothetical protein [Pirellula sp.]
MQISGRLVIVVMFALAFAMSGGAWLYQYNYSRRSAEFWGESSRLIGKSPELQFLELAPLELPDDAEAADESKAGEEAAVEATDGSKDEAKDEIVDPDNLVAGRAVTGYDDLRNEKGLIHLRHIFIQDDNFQWDARSREAAGTERDWAYALRFVEGPSEQVVLLRRDFELLGKLSADGKQVDVLPCPKIAQPLQRYLTDVGALKPAAKADDKPVAAAEPAVR